MAHAIINTHVQDLSNVVQAPSLWDIVRDFHALGELSKAHLIKEFIHEHERVKAEVRNLRAWQTVASDEANQSNKSIG